jgi:adenylate cyclase
MKKRIIILQVLFFVLSSSSLFLFTRQIISEHQSKEKVSSVLNKVVSEEIAQEILKGEVHLGGEKMRVTVMFADIRNFTRMIQRMNPQEVAEFLNTCMTKISGVIEAQGGVVDKYVGDSMMALFGAPLPKADSALAAVTSALNILEEIEVWNTERIEAGKPPIHMGIGIHTGEVLAGNIGSEKRLNYTVIGRNVNLASRLCASAQGMEIRISRETWNEPHVQEKMQAEELGFIPLKGFDEPIEVFRVTGGKF